MESDLITLTRQEMFAIIRKHLLTQNVQAVGAIGCSYRGHNGTKCAIGILIPDDKYDPNMEGAQIHSSPRVRALFMESDLSFLYDIQNIHDGYMPNEWPERLEAFRVRWGLEN